MVWSIRSAANAGYLRDEFARHFVHPAQAQRRAPIINRGTFARITALRTIIRRFLQLAPTGDGGTTSRQVLVLGAGFDTAVFQLQKEGDLAGAAFFELDFPDIVQQKSRIIAGSAELTASLCGAAEDSGGRLQIDTQTQELTVHAGAMPGGDEASPRRGGQYSLLAADLRDLDRVRETLAQAGFDSSLPTLVISECVLIYMEPEHSDRVIEWIASTLPQAAFVLYEQILPSDPFGKIMVRNIASRGCPLKSIAMYPGLEEMCERFRTQGWQWAVAKDMDVLYKHMLDREEKARTERLEMFDEFEEWHLLMQHYCLLFAAVDRTTTPTMAGRRAGTDEKVDGPQNEDTQAQHERGQRVPLSWLEAVGDPIAQA